MAGDPGGPPARRASDRGRYGRLNRDRVLAAALDLVDREGLSALSMRRLGAELGVEAMALYRYAAGKDALLEGLVEALYLELETRLAEDRGGPSEPPADVPAWRAELHRVALALYETGLRHPQVVPLLSTRMLAVPLARRPLTVLRAHERVLTLLYEAGLDETRAAAVFEAYTAWLLGYIAVEVRPMVDSPDEQDPAFRLGLHRMPPRELPLLRRTAAPLSERCGPRGLAAGLDALLDAFTGAGPDGPGT